MSEAKARKRITLDATTLAESPSRAIVAADSWSFSGISNPFF
jgi:hypothetical protein